MSDQEETPKQAKIVACAVARNLEDFELLIDDFEREFGETLGVYAGEMRDKRVVRAKENTNTLPTKMTLAKMILTVLPLLVILVGPSLYDMYVHLFQAY